MRDDGGETLEAAVGGHEGLEGLEGLILVGEDEVLDTTNLLEGPGNGEVGVVPEDAIIKFAIELLGAFVADDGGFEDEVAMGAACGDEDLMARGGQKIEGKPLLEGGAVLPEVDHDIPDMTRDAANKLGLLLFALEVEGADDALVAGGVEDFLEVVRHTIGFEDFLGVVFRETTTDVFGIEEGNLEEAFNGGFLKGKALHY